MEDDLGGEGFPESTSRVQAIEQEEVGETTIMNVKLSIGFAAAGDDNK